MSRFASLALLAVLTLALAIPTQHFALAQNGYTVTLTMVGPDNKPLAGVEVVVINASDGKTVAKATTDANGVAKFTLENGTYIVLCSPSYAIISGIYVAGPSNLIVNASRFHYVNITSVPVAVKVNVVVAPFPKVRVELGTNVTVYSSLALNISVPDHVYKLPFKYVLKELDLDGSTVNGTSVLVDVATSNHAVKAVYEKTFAVTLSPLMVGVVALVLVVLIALALKFSSKAAATVIRELCGRRFVKRRW